jgi:hypothetical protein
MKQKNIFSMETQNYIIKNIRKFFQNAVNDEDFSTFCQDNFYEFYNNFTAGQTLNQRISDLIDFCMKRNKMQDLVHFMKEANGVKFTDFLPYLEAQSDKNELNVTGNDKLVIHETPQNEAKKNNVITTNGSGNIIIQDLSKGNDINISISK